MKNEKAVTIICSIGMVGFLIFMMDDSGDGITWWLPFIIIITVLLFIFAVIPMWKGDYKDAKKSYKRYKEMGKK